MIPCCECGEVFTDEEGLVIVVPVADENKKPIKVYHCKCAPISPVI